MKTVEEIRETLLNFHGTENWHRFSPLFPKVLLTDGAKYIADACDAYWLMDVIASHLPRTDEVSETFGVVKLIVTKNKVLFLLAPDFPAEPNDVLVKQKITFTDFPLNEIKFYVVYDGENWVVMLPSEY